MTTIHPDPSAKKAPIGNTINKHPRGFLNKAKQYTFNFLKNAFSWLKHSFSIRRSCKKASNVTPKPSAPTMDPASILENIHTEKKKPKSNQKWNALEQQNIDFLTFNLDMPPTRFQQAVPLYKQDPHLNMDAAPLIQFLTSKLKEGIRLAIQDKDIITTQEEQLLSSVLEACDTYNNLSLDNIDRAFVPVFAVTSTHTSRSEILANLDSVALMLKNTYKICLHNEDIKQFHLAVETFEDIERSITSRDINSDNFMSDGVLVRLEQDARKLSIDLTLAERAEHIIQRNSLIAQNAELAHKALSLENQHPHLAQEIISSLPILKNKTSLLYNKTLFQQSAASIFEQLISPSPSPSAIANIILQLYQSNFAQPTTQEEIVSGAKDILARISRTIRTTIKTLTDDLISSASDTLVTQTINSWAENAIAETIDTLSEPSNINNIIALISPILLR